MLLLLFQTVIICESVLRLVCFVEFIFLMMDFFSSERFTEKVIVYFILFFIIYVVIYL